MRRRSAFTLVELLVVIGVIGLLVAMLLPALNRARRQSKTVACMSNLKQIGAAIQMYVIDNKGYLPGPTWGGLAPRYKKDEAALPAYLAKYMRYAPADNVNYDDQHVATAFICPGFFDVKGFASIESSIIWEAYNPKEYFGYPGNSKPKPITKVRRPAESGAMRDFDWGIANIIGVSAAFKPYVAFSPAHGGVAEKGTSQVGKTQALRNYLYFDWHVATVRDANTYMPAP